MPIAPLHPPTQQVPLVLLHSPPRLPEALGNFQNVLSSARHHSRNSHRPRSLFRPAYAVAMENHQRRPTRSQARSKNSAAQPGRGNPWTMLLLASLIASWHQCRDCQVSRLVGAPGMEAHQQILVWIGAGGWGRGAREKSREEASAREAGFPLSIFHSLLFLASEKWESHRERHP